VKLAKGSIFKVLVQNIQEVDKPDCSELTQVATYSLKAERPSFSTGSMPGFAYLLTKMLFLSQIRPKNSVSEPW
jgi:hypothetical protein